MKIRSLAIENFRRFRDPVRLEGLSDGLNLICEPNESGKSTILEAMRAALFERHGANSAFIKSLRPWGDETAPSVGLAFELDGGLWTVSKRFIQKPQISLTGPGGQTLASDAAEEKLQALLGFARAGTRGADEESRGVLGLLWVEQGAALSLDGPGRMARQTIESVPAGEVGAVTGGKRTLAVTGAVEAAYTALRTAKTGQATGKLHDAQRRVEIAVAARDAAERANEHYSDVLDQLVAAREELKRLERDAADPAQTEAEAGWKRDLETAKAAAARLRETRAALGEAISRREQAEKALSDRKSLREGLVSAERSVGAAQADLEAFAPTSDLAAAAETECAQDLAAAQGVLRDAESKADKAREAERASVRARALTSAFARLDAAEILSEALDGACEALDACAIDDGTYDHLVELDRRAALARAALEAGAPILELAFHEGGAERTRLDGVPAQAGRVTVVRPVELEVADVGVFTFRPPETAGLAAETASKRADDAYSAALKSVGVGTLAEAHAVVTRRRDASVRVGTFSAKLEATCPADTALGIAAGYEALRAALHDMDRPAGSPEDSVKVGEAAEAAERALADSRVGERQAAEAHKAAADALARAEEKQRALTGKLNETAALRDHIKNALEAAKASRSDDALEEALQLVRQNEGRELANVESAAQAAAGFSVEELERRLANAEARRRNIEQERVRLAGEIGRLSQAARSEGERGPASELEAARDAEASAQAALSALTYEADVLALLRKVLAEASQEATRLYLGPVTKRVSPYVQRLLPGAGLEMSEAMSAGGLTRSGRIEAAEHLSRGTQEQLAILTRIAFADLLLDKGQPVSLILDDALVYSDDSRLETMTDIITEVARSMQVIVLTCRKRAFMHLDANRVSLQPVTSLSRLVSA